MPQMSHKDDQFLPFFEVACLFEALGLGSLSNAYALQLTKARTPFYQELCSQAICFCLLSSCDAEEKDQQAHAHAAAKRLQVLF